MSILKFVSSMAPPPGPRGPGYWFIVQGDALIVRPVGARAVVPTAVDPVEIGITPVRVIYLGYLEEENATHLHCYAAEMAADAPLPEGMVADGLRSLYPRLGDALFGVAGRAVQLLAWDRTHHHCGQCGTPTEDAEHERAKRCPSCGLVLKRWMKIGHPSSSEFCAAVAMLESRFCMPLSSCCGVPAPGTPCSIWRRMSSAVNFIGMTQALYQGHSLHWTIP